MTKALKILAGCSLAGIAGYGISLVVGTPALILAFSAFALYSLAILVYVAAVRVLAMTLWWVLPGSFRDKSRRVRFRVVVLAVLTIFLGLGWSSNYYWFPSPLHPTSLLADVVTLFLSLFAGWVLLGFSLPRALGLAGVIGVCGGAFYFLATFSGGPPGGARKPPTEALAALPYVTWTPAGDSIHRSGVTLYDRERSFAGFNVYNSRNLSEAYLMDMSGNIVHTWAADVLEDDEWLFVRLLPNGDVLAMIEERMLIRLDWNSNLIWQKAFKLHHDLDLTDDGRIVTLTERWDLVPLYGVPVPIVTEHIVVLSRQREVETEMPLYQVLRDVIPTRHLSAIYFWMIHPKNLARSLGKLARHDYNFMGNNISDIIHSNRVSIITRDIDGVCKTGDLLYCARNNDLIGIIDPDREELVWSWGPGELQRPHHPTFLDNGNILIFDNGWWRKFTRIIELDPVTKRIVWEYRADNPQDFFSRTRGSSQRLPNGNTLITESDNGRVFEVTRDGELVWEFYNPEVRHEDKSRSIIYRCLRITDPDAYPCLAGLDPYADDSAASSTR